MNEIYRQQKVKNTVHVYKENKMNTTSTTLGYSGERDRNYHKGLPFNLH